MASPHESHHYYETSSCLPCTSGASWKNLWDESNNRNSSDSNDGTTNSASSLKDEMKQAEDMISNELNKLSMKERSEAYDDLHCVGDELSQTPEMVQTSLVEFDQAIPNYQNAAYDIALQQNKAFVEDPSFRLKFLRAQLHNVDKAVQQMMNFLKYKGEYFGEDKIAREITLEDLTQEDLDLMLSGLIHVQAERDRMGRVIVYTLSKMIGRFKPKSTYRAAYYLNYNILLSLPEVQLKGMVEVHIDTPRPDLEAMTPANDEFTRSLFHACFSIPFRHSARHLLLKKSDNRNQAMENALLSLSMSVYSMYSKVRTRIHYGTVMELQYMLRSHGIPLDTFPVDMHGHIRRDIINAWFYEHSLAKEGSKSVVPKALGTAAKDNSVSVVGNTKVPRDAPDTKFEAATFSDNVVLSGRGSFYQPLAGNVRFRKIIEDHSDEYDTLSRHDKRELTIKLTHELLANNFRFLKSTEGGGWVTLDVQEVRTKVSQQFRTIRKKK